jgi:hypothetical protein
MVNVNTYDHGTGSHGVQDFDNALLYPSFPDHSLASKESGMIHSDQEYERVESLISVMAQTLRMIETSVERCDPELQTLLGAQYRAQTQALRGEQAGYERRKARMDQLNEHAKAGRSLDNAHMAERQIGMIESTLDTIRTRVSQLERMVPLNHARLQGARAELELHEGLLAEWQEFDEELRSKE